MAKNITLERGKTIINFISAINHDKCVYDATLATVRQLFNHDSCKVIGGLSAGGGLANLKVIGKRIVTVNIDA